eukprot:COSAG02_NODE_777_length_17301_cov_8.632310_19_plen_65_part_00
MQALVTRKVGVVVCEKALWGAAAAAVAGCVLYNQENRSIVVTPLVKDHNGVSLDAGRMATNQRH